jgi:peptidoglycan hydrolase CwlO-like protein
MSNEPCRQCGRILQGEENYCPDCGLPLHTRSLTEDLVADKRQPERAIPWLGIIPIALAAVAIVLSGAAVYMIYDQGNQQEAYNEQTDEQLGSLVRTLQMLDERMSGSDNQMASVQSEVKVMQEHIGITEQELRRARALADQLKQEQEKNVRALRTQLERKADVDTVETLEKTAESKIQVVSSDLDEVKEEVRSGQQELEKTREQLTKLGVIINDQGQLIATNATALDELRRKGDRDYFTFNVRRRQRNTVAGVGLELRKADTKKQAADFKVFIDDREMDNRQIYVNRPITFYGGRDRDLYELVVNQVARDRISGYISVPKGKVAASASPILK